MINTSRLADIVGNILQEKTDEMKSILAQSDSVATGNLTQSILFDVNVEGSRIEGTISMPTNEKGVEYWQFVDKGISGTRIKHAGTPFSFKNEHVSAGFEKAIATWMKAKYGVGLGYNAPRGQFYGMAVNIKRRGMMATAFFTDPIETVLQSASAKVLPGVSQQIFSNLKLR